MSGTQSSEEAPKSPGIVETKTIDIPLPSDGLRLEKGGILRELTVAYESYGERAPSGDNVVYVCHALTGDAHVAGRHDPSDPKPGWWDEMVGPGRGIDTDYYQVICANILGGCGGTTGPCSTNPETGQPYGSSFPAITVGDMVRVQRLLLHELGVERLAAVVGGSLGGMQVLEWSIRFPDAVDRCICIASGASLSTQALAFDLVARDAIESDPGWRGGDYYGREAGPEWGLAHARKIGHITYLSPEIMQKKFGRETTSAEYDKHRGSHRFQVESYLDHQGRKLVERFDANSYLRITQAMDSYDLERQHGTLQDAFAGVKAKFLVVALSSDWLFPPEQSIALANALLRAGKEVSCCTLCAPYGHDAFLVDIEHLTETIRAFLPWVAPRSRAARTGPGTPADPSGTGGNRSAGSKEYVEHRLIAEMVSPGSRVLDLGCGDGALLSRLREEKDATGFGIDIDVGNVIHVIDRGHDVFQGDLDQGLAVIPDNSYEYAILSSTLQVVKRPRQVLRELVRVAREGIVTFPNFANWQNRLCIGFHGRMPKSDVLPFEWYDSPNIHLASRDDFLALCREEGIEIVDMFCIPEHWVDRALIKMKRCNLGAQRILARVAKSTSGSASFRTCKLPG